MKGRRLRSQATRLALLPLFLALASCLASAEPGTKDALPAWSQSIVTVEIARKSYDYFQPWSKRTQRSQKTGVVLPDHQILTTADELFDRTLIRLQKGGRGRWWVGEVAWLDYHANLALVTTSEEAFWRDLQPAAMGGAIPPDGSLQVLRWREGNLENRRAEFTQFAVREGQLSPVNQVVLEAGSEIQSAGWGEPLVAGSRMVGLVRAQDGRTCVATPAPVIQSILAAQKKGAFRGLGYFHFYWQPAENPTCLASLKLPGEPRGVIVTDVPPRPDAAEQVLRPRDILLQIDGFDIDMQGDYKDPDFGHLMLENLSTRNRWAGDDLRMKIWREGRPLDITYRLPRFDYTNALVPNATYDQDPEYLIVGGLVFQPLTDSYLQSWGPEWKRRAPFRLNYYNQQSPTPERPALVILSQVLPDPYNIGYQEQRYLVVDKVNGQPIRRLTDLRAALDQPLNGFHTIQFVRGDSLQKMVVAAGGAAEQATARVLKRYGIGEARHFAGD